MVIIAVQGHRDTVAIENGSVRAMRKRLLTSHAAASIAIATDKTLKVLATCFHLRRAKSMRYSERVSMVNLAGRSPSKPTH